MLRRRNAFELQGVIKTWLSNPYKLALITCIALAVWVLCAESMAGAHALAVPLVLALLPCMLGLALNVEVDLQCHLSHRVQGHAMM